MPDFDNTHEIIRRFEPILKDLNPFELHILNKMVVARIRLIHKAGALISMANFNVGDRVSWIGKDGITRTGIIMRLNSKTASINVGDEGYWNVSPQLLRKES